MVALAAERPLVDPLAGSPSCSCQLVANLVTELDLLKNCHFPSWL